MHDIVMLQVPLGVLQKNESLSADMIDILEHAQKYVPTVGETVKPILFGGDQVTRERATHAQDAKAQSSGSQKKLKGVIPKVEDWHTRMCFYQVRTMCTFNQIIINDI